LPENSLTLRRQNWRQTSVLSKSDFLLPVSQLVSTEIKEFDTFQNRIEDKSSNSQEYRIAIFIEKTWLKSQFP
jgi:hypothetical protein